MKNFKLELTAALNSALANAPTSAPDTGPGKVVIPIPLRSVFNNGGFQLTLWNTPEAIREVLSNINRIPGSSPLSCPKVRMPGDGHDYGDVALSIYGDAGAAADKLQGQLDMAAELGIDERSQRDLAGVIENLRERAEATSDPKQQHSRVVFKIIGELRAKKEAADKAASTRACALAVETHPDMPTLKRLIAEHEEKNASARIVNPNSGSSPLAFCTRGSVSYAGVGGYKRNTKHNPVIRALQETIARSAGVWNYRAKRVDMTRYHGAYAEAA